jgi:antitoxin HicB
MKYHYRIHKEGKGYWAECIEADGWVTQANTLAELEKNMHEALNAVLDEPPESNWLPPEPDPRLKGRNIAEVAVEPGIALATLIRKERLEHRLTQRVAAGKLGFKNVIQYQRLESGKTLNPELTTLIKLKRLFPRLSVDAALA